MPDATRKAASAIEHTPRHAVCVTGLQRSYPEISHNLHYSLSHLYAGWHHGGNQPNGRSGTEHAHVREGHARPASAQKSGFALDRHVTFFGVRPANDSWATVRVDLPPMQNESIQTPCGPNRPVWFSAYARTHSQRITYAHSFVQSLCDLRACHEMIQAHEQRVGRPFSTLARLRLDLAWETPLTMPPTLDPGVVYTSRMNTKAGVNDKWALGRRAPMGAYLDRVQYIAVANALYNGTGQGVSTCASLVRAGLLYYICPSVAHGAPFVCSPQQTQGTSWQSWQMGDRSGGPVDRRKFTLTSESFLHWVLWRSNISIGYEPGWMFCKFGNSINTTSRLCVPRMRKKIGCGSLICQGGLTDCFCKNSTCTPSSWYCRNASGIQVRARLLCNALSP